VKRVLNILNDGPDELSGRLIEAMKGSCEISVADLSSNDISYDELVEQIFSHDLVISW